MRGVKASRRGPSISHLMFVDDNIILGEASREGALVIKEILKVYERCLGQTVNFNKSTVFFSRNSTTTVKDYVLRLMGMQVFTNTERYLGLPNVVR